MADRASALTSCLIPGTSGLIGPDGPGVHLSEIPDLTLWQVSAWAETAGAVADGLGAALGVTPPSFGRVAVGAAGSLIRIEPLKWWCLGMTPFEAPDAEQGTLLDLSHSRIVIRVAGRAAAALLTRMVPIDLRDGAFANSSFAATSACHSGVQLIRRDGNDGTAAYDLYTPRSFAEDIWGETAHHAQQFGLTITG